MGIIYNIYKHFLDRHRQFKFALRFIKKKFIFSIGYNNNMELQIDLVVIFYLLSKRKNKKKQELKKWLTDDNTYKVLSSRYDSFARSIKTL